MKILIITGITLVSLVVLFLIAALFVQKEYVIEKEVVIRKPRQEVFSYLRQMRNQDQFNVWIMSDKDLKKEYRGTDGTPGFVTSWEGKQAGKGEQEIKSIKEGERVDMELRFKKPFEGTSSAWFHTEAVNDGETRVKWGMKGANKYPMNMMNLVTDGLLGKDMMKGLSNLKIILEQ